MQATLTTSKLRAELSFAREIEVTPKAVHVKVYGFSETFPYEADSLIISISVPEGDSMQVACDDHTLVNGLQAVTVVSLEDRLVIVDARASGLRLEAGCVVVSEKDIGGKA
jgi:hypothetical protein